MNMKKSIAGVMAGALAVSAMATTVSAQDSIALSYDLKTYVSTVEEGSVQIVQTWADGAYYVDGYTGGDSTITFGASSDYIANVTALEFTGTPLNDITGSSAVAGTTTTMKWYNDADYYTSGAIYSSDVLNMPISTTGTSGAYDLSKYEVTALGQSADANGNTYAFKTAVAKMTYEVISYEYASGTSPLYAYDWSTGAFAYVTYIDDVTVDVVARSLTATDALTGTYSLAVGSFTAAYESELVMPMRSDLEDPANVIDALTSRKTDDNYYTTPLAVINDAIANHENVTFTFTSFDGYVATDASSIYSRDWGTWEGDTTYPMGWIIPGVAYGWETCDYDWYNPYFSQQLYSGTDHNYTEYGTDDYSNYGSYSSACGVNLFTGAIVVNSEITMQLQDTDKFTWGLNTLTFDWNSITEDGKVTEAKTFLTSMLLYTPTEWYWDSLSVVVDDSETDTADVGAGIESDEDEIADVEEVVEEVVEEPEVVVTEAAVEEVVQSPATGNAPVALAVIPVALAAAAVVAKKRG